MAALDHDQSRDPGRTIASVIQGQVGTQRKKAPPDLHLVKKKRRHCKQREKGKCLLSAISIMDRSHRGARSSLLRAK